jgi:hypothetical protein
VRLKMTRRSKETASSIELHLALVSRHQTQYKRQPLSRTASTGPYRVTTVFPRRKTQYPREPIPNLLDRLLPSGPILVR